MKRKVISLILSIVTVAGIAVGCSSTAASSSSQSAGAASAGASSASQSGKKQPYVIWVNPLVGSAVFTQADEGIKAASQKYGFKLKIVGPSTLDDTQMVQALESAIDESPDLIVTTPYDYSALEQSYKKAAAKKIPIIDISSDSPKEGRVSFIGTDNTKYGQLAADYINKQKNGKANVLIMMANLDTSNQLEQKKAFEAQAAAKYPGIKVVLTDADKGDPSAAVQKFQDILKAHPEIDTILSLESIGGPSAAVVLKEKNLIGKVTVLAIDDNKDTLSYIKNDVLWGTMAQNFYKMGEKAGELAMDYLNGKTVPSTFDSGTVLITKSNLDTYSKEFYK